MNDQALMSRPTHARFVILGLLMALCFVGQFNRVSISVAGTEKMIDEFGVSDTKMGTVYSAYLLVYTLCMIPGGWLIDGRGATFALTAMVVCSVPLVFATGLVRPLAAAGMALPALWLVRSLLGMSCAPLHPGAARMVWSWTPSGSRNVSNGLVTAAALLAYAATYPLFGAMIDRFDWPTAFAICSLVTAVLAVAWIVCAGDNPARHRWVNVAERRLLVADPVVRAVEHRNETEMNITTLDSNPNAARRSEPSKQTDTRWWTLFSSRSLILLAISYGAVGYFQYLFVFWMERYLITELHVDTDLSRNYTAVCMLAMAAGMFLGGGVSDRLSMRFGPRVGRAVLPIAGMFTSALLLGVGMAASEPRWIVTWFALALGVLGMGESSFWTTAIALGGHRGGSSAAIMNTGGNTGGVLAPMLTPYLAGLFGWEVAMGVAGVSCLLGAVLWLYIDPRERADGDSASADDGG